MLNGLTDNYYERDDTTETSQQLWTLSFICVSTSKGLYLSYQVVVTKQHNKGIINKAYTHSDACKCFDCKDFMIARNVKMHDCIRSKKLNSRYLSKVLPTDRTNRLVERLLEHNHRFSSISMKAWRTDQCQRHKR